MAKMQVLRSMGRGLVSAVKAGMSMVTTGVPERTTHYGWLNEPFAGAWQRNITAEPLKGLMGYSVIYACNDRISSDIAKLEPMLLQDDESTGIWSKVAKASPFWAVLRKPNHFQNRIQFFKQWLLHKLMHGNVYALKQRDGRGVVVALYLLDPRRVTPFVTPDGDVYYSLGGDELSRIPTGMMVPAKEIIHDRGPTLWHPLVGVPPIYACGVSGTQGMRIQNNSAMFFQNMSRPSGMLTAPATIKEETAIRLKRDFEENYSGANIGRLFIAGDSLKYEAMTIPAETSQLIEQLGWTVEDCARAYAMPLYKINAGPVPTAGNVEALELQYYSGCLQILIEASEQCLTEGMELGTPGYRVQFDLSGLLRMDSAAKTTKLAEEVKAGITSPNEARLELNRPPVKGGESPYLQQQQFSLAALSERDQDKPFAKPSTPPPAAPTAPAAEDEETVDEAAREEAAKAALSAGEAERIAKAAEAAAAQAAGAIERVIREAEERAAAENEKAATAVRAAEDRAAEQERKATEAAEQMRDLMTRLEVIEKGVVPVLTLDEDELDCLAEVLTKGFETLSV